MLHQMMMLLHLEMQLRQQALNGFTAATEPHTRLQRLDEVLALNEQLNEVGTILSVLLSADPTAAMRGARGRVELTARRVPPITSPRAPPPPRPIPSPQTPRQAEFLGSTATQDSSENEEDSESGESEVSIVTARRIRERGISINIAGADQVAVTASTPGASLPRGGTRRPSQTQDPSAPTSAGDHSPRAEGASGEPSTPPIAAPRESSRPRNTTGQLGINHAAVANNMRLLRRDPERNALREQAANPAASEVTPGSTPATPRDSNANGNGTTLPPLSLPALSPRRPSVSSSVSQPPSESLDADEADSGLPVGSIAHQLTMQELAAVRVAQGGAAPRTPAGPADTTPSLRPGTQSTADSHRPPRGAAIANSVARRNVPLDSNITASNRDSIEASRRREADTVTPQGRPGLLTASLDMSTTNTNRRNQTGAQISRQISERSSERSSLSRQVSERSSSDRSSLSRQQSESSSVSRQTSVGSDGSRRTSMDNSHAIIRELPSRPTSRTQQRRSYDLSDHMDGANVLNAAQLRRPGENSLENPYRRLSMPARDINGNSTGNTAPAGSQVNHRARARRAASISSATSRRDSGTAANSTTPAVRTTRGTVGRSTSQNRQAVPGPHQANLPSTSGQLLRARRRSENVDQGNRHNHSQSNRR